MKILYLVNNISKTSIPNRWAEFANSNKIGVEITIIDIYSFIRKFLFYRKNVDIIHGHHIKSMALYLVVNFWFKKKTIFTIHGSYLYLSEINKFFLKFILKKTTKVIFVNKILLDQLPNKMKLIIENKKEVILNGVDENYDFEKTDVFSKFKIDESKTNFFHPARFVKEKNHLQIIEAFSEVTKKYKNSNLILAGDGVLREEIKAKINDLNLTGFVQLIGVINRDEVYCFLDICDAFLMPSISEGLNVSFLEAISMNVKIMVSDIEQYTFPINKKGILLKDINVVLVDPKSLLSIEQGFESLIKMRKTEKNKYNKMFSIKTMMNSYVNLYKEVL